jgi:hypothetical protein
MGRLLVSFVATSDRGAQNDAVALDDGKTRSLVDYGGSAGPLAIALESQQEAAQKTLVIFLFKYGCRRRGQ